jgi:hypothetical protein
MHRREEVAVLRSRDGVRADNGSGRQYSRESKAADDAAEAKVAGAHAATDASAVAFLGFLAVVLAFAFSLAFKISRDGPSA